MKKIVLAFTLATLTASTVVPATAAINVRQLEQQRQIDAGKRSGKLTERERRSLKAEQRSIVMLERQMRARHGGQLTRRDKQILHARQRAAGRHIRYEKYDLQRGKNHLPFHN